MILHHVVRGAGPPVVLLHSTATDGRQWQAQTVDLARDHTVVVPDLRGHGRSQMAAEPFSHAGDVVHLLDHLGIDRYALVGSSGGGDVALQVASTAPERVTALVLLCAAADGVEPTEDLRAFAEREAALLRDGDVDGATELNVRTWLPPDVDGVTRELFRAMQARAFEVQLAAGDDAHQQDAPVDLSRITCPATVVSGARDLPWFAMVADHLAAGLPESTRVELPWAGHLPNLERPEAITGLIRRAIQP